MYQAAMKVLATMLVLLCPWLAEGAGLAEVEQRLNAADNAWLQEYAEGNIFVDWRLAFTGGSAVGKDWTSRIQNHVRSKRMLAETNWQSDAWYGKYPMLRSLLNGAGNHNYQIGNLLLGPGAWGNVRHAIQLANRAGGRDAADIHTLADLRSHLLPWYPIPLERIGPYDPRGRLGASLHNMQERKTDR